MARAGEFGVILLVFDVGCRCRSWTKAHFKAECCVCIFISNEIGRTGFNRREKENVALLALLWYSYCAVD